MNSAALGTRSLRRRQPLSDSVSPAHLTERDAAGPPVLQSIPLMPKLTTDLSRGSDVEQDQRSGQQAGVRPDRRNDVHVDEGISAQHHADLASNDYETNTEQNGRVGKVDLDRHRSVRSEICVSPTWSSNAKKKSRRREKRQKEKEQKDMEKKLKREAMGKPREPRRLSKAPPGYHSSRASSANSFARFSRPLSIRSFWSNRTSRASSIHDSEDRDRASSRRNSMSSQGEGSTRQYKLLGIFPRRPGAQNRKQTAEDAPARTLHTTRKNADLRATAQADDRRASLTEPSPAEGTAASKSSGDLASSSTGQGQPKQSDYKRLTKHRPNIPGFSDNSAVREGEKEAPTIPRNKQSETRERLEDTLGDIAAAADSVASRSSACRQRESNKENHETDKPGDFKEPSLSRRSPLESIVANAASIIKAEEHSGPTEDQSPNPEPLSDQPASEAAMPGDAIKSKPVDNKQAVQVCKDVRAKDSSDTRFAATPNDAIEQQGQLPEDVAKGEISSRPVVDTPGEPLKGDPEELVESAEPKSTEQTPGSISEPQPSLPAATSSSPDDNEKKPEQNDSDPLRKPVVPASRDPRFQSSPLAAPPLIVQDPEDNVPREAGQDDEADKSVETRRPAKLRRRSASSSRNEIPSQNQGSYFGRFWKAGKKEKKAKESSGKDSDREANGTDVREGNKAARVEDDARIGSNNVDSSPNDTTQHDAVDDIAATGAGALSLPRRSTAPDGSVPTHSRRTVSDTTVPLADNADVKKRPFSVDSPSKDMLGSAPGRNSATTLTLRDLMNEPTMTAATAKGSSQTKSDNDRHVGPSNILTAGSPGQRTQRTAFYQGQRVAKMFVICCHCKFWHDMPSEAYSNLALPQAGPSTPPQVDGETATQAKREANGCKSDNPGGNAGNPNGAQETSADKVPAGGATSNSAALKPRDDSKASTTRPTSSGSVLALQTSASCCWCNHRMTRSCCAGWTAVVNLHERHH